MECNERRSAVSKAVATQTVQILNVTDKWAQSIHLAAKSSLSGAILGTHHKHPWPNHTTLMCATKRNEHYNSHLFPFPCQNTNVLVVL